MRSCFVMLSTVALLLGAMTSTASPLGAQDQAGVHDQPLFSAMPLVSWADSSKEMVQPPASQEALSPPKLLPQDKRVFKTDQQKIRLSDLPLIQENTNIRTAYLQEHNASSLFPGTVPPAMPADELAARSLASPHRLQAIAQTVHILTGNPSFAYAAHPFSDDEYTDIAQTFLAQFDRQKLFLSAQDVHRLTQTPRAINAIAKAVAGDDLSWIDKAMSLMKKRINKRMLQMKSIVAHQDDLFALESPDQSYVSSTTWHPKKELNALWITCLRDEAVSAILAEQQDSSSPLDTTSPQARQRVKEAVSKEFDKVMNILSDLDAIDIQEAFINAFTSHLDPHTVYLAPRQKSLFQASLNKTMDGVGMMMKIDDRQQIVVRGTIPNSAASKAGLAPGDVILRAGPTANALVPLTGKGLDEVVNIIKGPLGTSVVLEIQSHPDQPTKMVVLQRQRLHLLDSLATSQLVTIPGDHVKNMLVIKIPLFYQDPSHRHQRGGSMSEDVRALLQEAMKEHALDGVVLDLRGNGGGIMNEAVSLVGLFVDQGVVVSVRSASGKVQSIDIPAKNKAIWKGPLMVLIDQRSASASEIATAALQDYNRALVVGERSYGKGSAQTLIDFDAWTQMPMGVYGQLNLTTMMFFRPLGASTQLHGVVPDIKVAVDRSSAYGESSKQHSLTAQHLDDVAFQGAPVAITPQNPTPWQARRVALQKQSDARWRSHPWFGLWKSSIAPAAPQLSSLDPQIRWKAYMDESAQEKQLAQAWKDEGAQDQDGASSDAVLREALAVAKDAFFQPAPTDQDKP